MYSENVLILTSWSYKDALIQTYTLPYVRIMRKNLSKDKKIFFRTMEQKKFKLSAEEAKKEKEKLKDENLYWLESQYNSSFIKNALNTLIGFFHLWRFCKINKIGVIHIWCTPVSVFAYPLSLVTDIPVIIDSYEPHAEAMVENGTWKSGSLKFRVLFHFEKLISHKAKVVISATQGMKKYALEKYKAEFETFYVKPACVNLELFSVENQSGQSLRVELGLEDKIVCVYAGKFGGIYLEKEIFDFFKVAEEYWPGKFIVLLLTSHSDAEVDSFCAESGVDRNIIIKKFLPHHLVPEYMRIADFAITPVKPVSTKRYCTPIKNGEYWALGLPVVIPANISDDSEIIEEANAGAVIKAFTKEEYKKALEKVSQYMKEPKVSLTNRIRKIAEEKRSFHIAEEIYKKIYC